MKHLILVLAVMAGLFATGCAVTGPGDRPDAVPPRMVVGQDNCRGWDRPGAFGPVPADKQALGNRYCKTGSGANSPCGTWQTAMGFHASAQDFDGRSFPDGGFFCAR